MGACPESRDSSSACHSARCSIRAAIRTVAAAQTADSSSPASRISDRRSNIGCCDNFAAAHRRPRHNWPPNVGKILQQRFVRAVKRRADDKFITRRLERAPHFVHQRPRGGSHLAPPACWFPRCGELQCRPYFLFDVRQTLPQRLPIGPRRRCQFIKRLFRLASSL